MDTFKYSRHMVDRVSGRVTQSRWDRHSNPVGTDTAAQMGQTEPPRWDRQSNPDETDKPT